MANSSSERHPPRPLRHDDVGVSEVVGFLLTFGIIATILLVAMLGFNQAQQRAEVRLVEIQGQSAAQRVASASVDLALFASEHPYDTEVAIDLPAELQGVSYSVAVCQTGSACGDGATWCLTNACPYVKVSSFRGEPQRQSTFLLAGQEFCHDRGDAASGVPVAYRGGRNTSGGGISLVTYFAEDATIPADVDATLAGNQRLDDCIGLQDERT